jgi:glucose repression mediator protein
LWYGIGILYDRYGSLEHAEEAFSSVIRMDPSTSHVVISLASLGTVFETLLCHLDFDKSDEIFFRLGIIYKQQQKYEKSLDVRASLLFRFGLFD